MHRVHSLRRVILLLTAVLLWCFMTTATVADDSPATADPTAGAQESVKVNVFYLTNRERRAGEPVAGAYSGERGETHFGRCEVEFTPIPLINELATKLPFYMKSEINLVSLAEAVDPPLFWEQVEVAREHTSSGSLVLFVHGYNYSFERTCRMAAEMQRYLQGKATLLVFSWPSNGIPTDYVSDQADIEWSVPMLADLIGELGDRIGQANVQIVAHSLGTRGVVFALQRLAYQRVERPAIGQLVLLAPDFDSQIFVDLLPELAPLTRGITLYASVNDAPLKLSRQLSGYPRLGEAGKYLTLVEGMDTIDVSSLGRYQITGHEYFYFHPMVRTDLVALLGSGRPAAERSGLQVRRQGGLQYWEFKGAADDEGSAASVED